MLDLARTSAFLLAAVTLTGSSASAQWVEIETPHFLVLSNVDVRTARNVALEFEQAREVFLAAMDADMDSELPVVIFAVADSDDLRTLLPGIGEELPVGVFGNSPDRRRIAVRLDVPRDQRFATLYHEYHHLLFRSASKRAPIWLIEGLAEFWSSMVPSPGGGLEIGRPSPAHLRTLSQLKMAPLEQLLAFRGRVHDQPRETIHLIYAQSWALVHHLMLGTGADARATLDSYIQLIDAGGDAVTSFESTYGPIASVEQELSDYLDRTMFPAMTVDLPEPPPASEFRTRDLSDADADAFVGGFIANGPWPDFAQDHLERALELEPSSTTAMEGMGFLKFRQGDFESAESWFDQAVASDRTSYLAHYFRAVLAMRRPGTSESVEAGLRRALELNASFPPGFVALSALVAEDEDRLDEALTLAEQATVLAPDAAPTWMNLADILERLGRDEEARQASERARNGETYWWSNDSKSPGTTH